MKFVGVDPGKSGAWAVINDEAEVLQVQRFNSWAEIYAEPIFAGKDKDVLIMLEQVGAFPGQGVVSTFSFGESSGGWKSLLEGHQIPFIMVPPQRWQKQLLGVFAKGESKKRAFQYISRRYPHLEFKEGKGSEGPIDSICLALYSRFNHTNQT